MIQTNTPHPSALTESVPTFVYVGVIVGIIFAVIVCCCCVRKCCCKTGSSKRDASAPQTAAAPAVHYRVSPSSSGYSDQLFIMCVAIFT